MIKLNGWVQDSPSDKDYLFSDVETKLVKVASSNDEHKLPEYTPISNQGSLGSCVANATVDALEILMGIQDPNSVVQLSRLFTYYNARNYTNDTDKDEGTYIRNAFQSLRDLGVCSENTWTYDIGKVFTQPSIMAYREANDNKIDSFYRISDTGTKRLEAIIRALNANFPVVFGARVSKQFTESFNLGEHLFNSPDVSIGNHAMIVVGYSLYPQLKFYIRNSWGSSWGTNGHCWMSSEYLTDIGTQDLWVPILVPNFV